MDPLSVVVGDGWVQIFPVASPGSAHGALRVLDVFRLECVVKFRESFV